MVQPVVETDHETMGALAHQSTESDPKASTIATQETMANPPPITNMPRRRTRAAIRNLWDKVKTAFDVACHQPRSSLGANLSSSTSPPIDNLNKAGSIAWLGLGATLRTLEKTPDMFPPMQSAVGALIECLDTVQTAAEARDDYERLASEFETLANNVKLHAKELSSENSSGSIANITSSINREVGLIKEKQARGQMNWSLRPAQDREDVIQCYRRVETAFKQLQANIGLPVLRNSNQQVTLLGTMSSVDEARYNSKYHKNLGRTGCMAGTRQVVIMGVRNWVQDPSAAKVCWVEGMAGIGKTAIAYTVCEELEGEKQLGASFFCSRSTPSCRDVSRIIPSIAYQLAQYSPAFRSALCGTLELDPSLGKAKMDVSQQFDKLIKSPLRETKAAFPEGVVVVIDALDECSDTRSVRLVLETIMRLSPALPIKFVVTSRPENVVQEAIISPNNYSHFVLHLQDVEQRTVEEDIKKYLMHALEAMVPFPSDEVLDQLTRCARGLFIYAAIATRYILLGEGYKSHVTRLHTLLAAGPASSDERESSRNQLQPDCLYSTILSTIFDEELEGSDRITMERIIGTLTCAREPLTVAALVSFLAVSETQVLALLRPLQSILLSCDDMGRISVLHLSFLDYMFDPLRSGYFYCDHTRYNEYLAHLCLDVMAQQLRFNICNLESSIVFDSDISDLESRIGARISPSLSYACRYWGEHLRLAGVSDDLHTKLADFLTSRLLFWMEVLNLMTCIREGESILLHAETWLLVAKASVEIQKLAADARDFVSHFASSPCIQCTPHIYISFLPFCAKSSWVYACYWGHTQGLIDLKGTAMGHMGPTQTGWVANSEILSLAWSPDSKLIVSGSTDKTIQIWDTRTRSVAVGPFEGHTGPVHSVAFSPSGIHVCSGSSDSTVRVWDAKRGSLILGPLTGHTAQVCAAVFSPDGSRIVSGSYDCTIRVWNTHTGEATTDPLKGHTGAVKSVAFSPDSRRLVSGSSDKTIRVWDASTGGTIAGPFGGHTDSVLSVAFSPGNMQVASGSSDSTLRVWDAQTGKPVIGPLGEHTGSIRSIAFSPDGTRIVSGSWDKKVRVWDGHTGNLVVGPLDGHTRAVNSVAYSPDGTQIVSGSDDHSIRVWEVSDQESMAGPSAGHSNAVNSVAFSPDGMRIVSSSNDYTVRVWDMCTGEPVIAPFRGHTGWVNSVAFSPDGMLIASGSRDQTIRVWHALSGDPAAVPFEGHTGWVTSVAFSPDGTRVASSSSDTTIRVWHSRTGGIAAGPFKGHTDWVNSIAFSPDGNRIASGSDDQSVRLWSADLRNTEFCLFKGHTGSVISVAFSPDGQQVVSGSSDCTIRMWDAHNGDLLVEPFKGHSVWVKSVAFSPDGRYVVSASYDCTIRVWDARTGNSLTSPLEGHTKSVNSVVFSPDGTRIASGSDDSTIRVWHAGTGDILTMSFAGHGHSIICNESSQSFKSFSFKNDGWLMIGNAPILWVPPAFRTHVPCPRNTLVIGPQGSVYNDSHELLFGTEWSKCYSPPPSTRTSATVSNLVISKPGAITTTSDLLTSRVSTPTRSIL